MQGSLKGTYGDTSAVFFFFNEQMSVFLKKILIEFRERESGREQETEKHRFVVPLIYAFIG